ncbi:HD domain-containing protein [Lachnospiraceae bacterium XBB2008]|nr:HD domain-containing protein [Lachnospiraceae bacterium XBB2008]
MFELIREHQLNVMLVLCGACATMAFMLLITRFLSPKRKRVILLMEVMALLLLWFDRLAYVYAGDLSHTGFVMVRISNFMVFFLTSGMCVGFNLFIKDYLSTEGAMEVLPRRLKVVEYLSTFGMILAIISALTGLYYFFDENNLYNRGPGFFLAYIVPLVCPLIDFSVIFQHRKRISKWIYISLVLFIFVPILFAVIQIFAYGISIVNMAMVVVSVCLYIFTYFDINDQVVHAHNIELQNMQGEQMRMQKLVDETATALMSAVEIKDEYAKGKSAKVADFARRIAEKCGKDKDYCDGIYYAALLHNVGMVGLPDGTEIDLENPDPEMIRRRAELGKEILSGIIDYPYLSEEAYYSSEHYDGTGLPEGLKGDEIPEMARIIAVADAYVTMTSRSRTGDGLPNFMAREMFVKEAGAKYDPVFADIMVKMIDRSGSEGMQEVSLETETEFDCNEYRDYVAIGIPVESDEKRIRFTYEASLDPDEGFSSPSIILFDAYDRRSHTDEKTISAYHYLEYGEIWFDDHMIMTAARTSQVTELIRNEDYAGRTGKGVKVGYEIIAGRTGDHVRIRMTGPEFTKEIIMVLPDKSKSSYIGLTGENCHITDVTIETTGRHIGPEDIPRIARAVDYTDHLESDFKNIQIDQNRSVSTPGVELSGKKKLAFHTLTLPGAELVWHCPYIVLYSSDDAKIGGPNYREYNLIKMNGENNGTGDYAQNSFTMKRTADFHGWEAWKEANKEGLDCEIVFERKGNRIITTTENSGVSTECITTIYEMPDKVYAALTGDEVALTDIRVLIERL